MPKQKSKNNSVKDFKNEKSLLLKWGTTTGSEQQKSRHI